MLHVLDHHSQQYVEHRHEDNLFDTHTHAAKATDESEQGSSEEPQAQHSHRLVGADGQWNPKQTSTTAIIVSYSVIHSQFDSNLTSRDHLDTVFRPPIELSSV